MAEKTKLWKADPLEWFPYALPASEARKLTGLPSEVCCGLYPDVADFGPNWENVLKAARWMEQFNRTGGIDPKTKFFQDSAMEIAFEGAYDLPQRTLDAARRLSYANNDPQVAALSFCGELLLQYIAWNGFALNVATYGRNHPSEENFAHAAKTYGLSFDDYRWKQPE